MPNHSNTCADSENFPGGWGVVWGIKLCGNEGPRPNFGNFTMWILKFFKGGGSLNYQKHFDNYIYIDLSLRSQSHDD